MRFFRLLPIFILILLSSCSHTGKYMAPVKLDGKYGYINEYGDMIIKPKFEDAWSFIRGAAIVKDSGKYGMIDKEGNYILTPQFDSVIPYSSSTIIVKSNGLFGFNETGTGKQIIAPTYQAVFYYTDHLCVVQKGSALGLVNDLGKIVCPVEMQDFKDMMGPGAKCMKQDTSDQVAMLLSLMQRGGGGKYGLINRKGEVMLPAQYDEIFDDITAGYYYPYLKSPDCPVDTSINLEDTQPPIGPGTYGIVDTTGKVITEPIFEDIPEYSDGFFRIKQHDKYGFADRSGKVVIAATYDFATSFSEGKAIVLSGSKASIINRSGAIMVA
ncbi:MAG TPA: WG repeat-containing protein, partial [Bacteroidia bacterium]|nr:WG repeat-containing protein [Bacteroidia bacterium]